MKDISLLKNMTVSSLFIIIVFSFFFEGKGDGCVGEYTLIPYYPNSMYFGCFPIDILVPNCTNNQAL